MNFDLEPVSDALLKAMEAPTDSPFPANEKVLSFQKPILPTEPARPKRGVGGRKYIRKDIFIDKYCTKRIRVELTPSVCNVCAFDVAAKAHGDWYGVPEYKKEDVLVALELHKKEEHPIRQDLIVDEDQLPNEWFGAPSIL